jgi:hypothetical protein
MYWKGCKAGAERAGVGVMFLFGAVNWSTTTKEKKIRCGLSWPPFKNIFNATNNQKHAAVINIGTKEWCKQRGAGRKQDSIILGAIKLGGGIKIK